MSEYQGSTIIRNRKNISSDSISLERQHGPWRDYRLSSDPNDRIERSDLDQRKRQTANK